METTTSTQLTTPISGNKAVERNLEERAAVEKESRARWAKDHPLREPGTTTATWKTYSRQKYPSTAFRLGYDKINWNA